MKELSTLIVLLMIGTSLFGQTNMQQYIAKEKTILLANLTPYKTYHTLDTATTNKINISERLAPMLLQMAGADMSEENIKSTQEELLSPEKIGLNIQSDVYLWVQKGEKIEDDPDDYYGRSSDPMFVNLVIPITDGTKFRAFLDKLFGIEKTKVMVPSGNAMNMVHEQILINWNKDRLIIAASTQENSYWEELEEYENKIKRSLLLHATALGKATEANSFAKDVDFQKHLDKNADFGVWVEYGNLMLDNAYPAELSFLKEALTELAGGMKIGGNGFLKKGSADFFLKMYNNEVMSRVIAESYKLTLNKDFFKYLDNTNLMGVYTFAMSPQSAIESYGKELYKILEKSKEGLMITNVLDIIDIFIDEDEIYTLFKGDMLMAISDLKVVERKSTDFEYNEESDKWEEVTYTEKEVLPIMSMMMSYGSEENIMNFIKLAANSGVISKRDEGIWIVGGVKEEVGFDVFIVVKNGVLIFTNDENIANNATAGIAKDKQVPAKDIKEISSYIQYAYLDASKIVSTVTKAYESMDKVLPMDLKDIEKYVSRLEFKTHHQKGNEMLTEFHLITPDKTKNIFQSMVDGALELMDKKKSSRGSEEDKEVDEIEIDEKDNGDGTKKL